MAAEMERRRARWEGKRSGRIARRRERGEGASRSRTRRVVCAETRPGVHAAGWNFVTLPGGTPAYLRGAGGGVPAGGRCAGSVTAQGAGGFMGGTLRGRDTCGGGVWSRACESLASNAERSCC